MNSSTLISKKTLYAGQTRMSDLPESWTDILVRLTMKVIHTYKVILSFGRRSSLFLIDYFSTYYCFLHRYLDNRLRRYGENIFPENGHIGIFTHLY